MSSYLNYFSLYPGSGKDRCWSHYYYNIFAIIGAIITGFAIYYIIKLNLITKNKVEEDCYKVIIANKTRIIIAMLLSFVLSFLAATFILNLYCKKYYFENWPLTSFLIMWILVSFVSSLIHMLVTKTVLAEVENDLERYCRMKTY
jgi:membrane protease YdiL (CAAX protease family)